MELPEIDEARTAKVVFSYMAAMLAIGVIGDFTRNAVLLWAALRLGVFFLWAVYGFVAVTYIAIAATLLYEAARMSRAWAIRFVDALIGAMQKF